MQARATRKVPDGKLIEVAVEYGDRIESATVTGDFFLQPPEARRDLEAALEGRPRDVDRETLVEAIEAVDATLVGFDAADLADATLEALA